MIEDINNYPIKINVPVPEWLKTYQKLNVIDYDLEIYDGIKNHLLEKQCHIETDKISTFILRKLQPTNMHGLDGCSNFIIDFNPAYQMLVLHHITCKREDEIHDKLNTADIKVLKREYGAERKIFSGKVDLSIILDDVKVNDIIEIAYTFIDLDTLNNENFNLVQATEYAVPLQQYFLTVIAQNHTLLKHKFYDELQDHFKVINEADYQVFVFERHNIPAKKPLDYLPPWYNQFGYLQICIQKEWQEIARNHAYFYRPLNLTESKFQHLIQQVSYEKLSAESIVLRMLDFVQSNVRYLSNFTTTHPIKPSDPNEVIKRSYGDCKDLSYLLINLLCKFKIDTFPILVSSYDGKNLPNYMPALNLFNHVIVLVIIGDKKYYIDPTILQNVKALDHLLIPDYSYGLICDDQSTELAKLNINAIRDHMSIWEDYELADSTSNIANFHAKTTLRGWPALRLISYLQVNPESMFWDQIDNFYRKTIKIQSIKSRNINFDKIQENEISYAAEYFGEIIGYTKLKKGYSCEFVLRDLLDYFVYKIPAELNHDYYFGVKITCDYKIKLIDKNLGNIINSKGIIEDKAFIFKQECTGKKESASIDTYLEIKESVIDKDRYVEFSKNHELAKWGLIVSLSVPTISKNLGGRIYYILLTSAIIISLLRGMGYYPGAYQDNAHTNVDTPVKHMISHIPIAGQLNEPAVPKVILPSSSKEISEWNFSFDSQDCNFQKKGTNIVRPSASSFCRRAK